MTSTLHQTTSAMAIMLGASGATLAHNIGEWVGICVGLTGIVMGFMSMWLGRKRRRLAELQAEKVLLEKEKLVIEIANERREYNEWKRK